MTVTAAHAGSRRPTQEQAALVRAQLAAILASDSFSSSKRCQDFLEFVVEHALAGDFETLTERFLGVELFGRAVDYETATDSIVRTRANDVRRRLAQYYAGLSSIPPVRINLVAGGYVPEFVWRSEDEVTRSSILVDTASTASPPPLRTLENMSLAPGAGTDLAPVPVAGVPRKAKVFLWVGTAVVLILAAVITQVGRPHRTNFDRFWQPVLDSPASPVLNLPTTDTLQLTLDPMRTLNALKQLKPGESLKLAPGDFIGFHDWHVSMPVLQATLSVSLALERKDKIPLVRIGTDLTRDELRGHPVIAIGSFSNPWTEENVSGLRFTFDRGNSDREPPRIRDAQNPSRSWSLPHTYPDPQTKDYAIVTRTFDPVTHVPFVSLAGLHSFGNQIGGEFVSQEASWNEVARRAPRGWEKMNMQVVLEADIVGTTPSSPRIIEVYFWK
jgi:hypothetical protein